MSIQLTETQILARSSAVRKKYLELAEREQYEESLIDFAGYVWPVVEPAIPFIRGWAIQAIAEHLEAVSYGHIRRLLINVPPGFSKSLMTDVFWPAWEWGPLNRPHLRYICASYSNHLTERDNLRCRNIVVNDRYRRLWGDRFGISNEQFTKIKFANDKTGWKLATSVGGIGVGERGDRFIIDDGNNTMEMESEAIRANTNMWFTEVVPDRLNNQQISAIVVIQQRLHEDDISGVAISREMGYTHLMIPMEYDKGRHCVTVLGVDDNGEQVKWEDPRTEDFDLAWEERFPQKIVEELKRDKGPYAFAGQYQQTPEPRGGSIIKRDFWQLWEEDRYPAFDYLVASLDTAYTTKEENDPSALTIWGVFRERETNNTKVMLVWAWQGRLEFHELVEEITETCTKTPLSEARKEKRGNQPRFNVDMLLIEAKSAGLSVGQELYRLFSQSGRFGIHFPNMNKGKYTQDKVARVHSIQHMFSDKMVYAPDRAFADLVINQMAIFPKGSHDDLVDTTSQALRYLRDSGILIRREEQAADEVEELAYRPRSVPLYPV